MSGICLAAPKGGRIAVKCGDVSVAHFLTSRPMTRGSDEFAIVTDAGFTLWPRVPDHAFDHADRRQK